MVPRPLTAIVAAATLAVVTYAGARPMGPLPPLGTLLDPVHGVLGAGAAGGLPRRSSVRIAGLRKEVDVRYDVRGVPHIFAASEEDAYRALGYVVARDRLFQMDIQTRAASGRLTELVGARALALDEEPRRLGMVQAAERKFRARDSKSESRKLIDAYASGVNAYIDALSPADYPVEYKLLNAQPERWRPVNSIYLLNRMGWTLASADPERVLARAAAVVGRAAASAIFPVHTPIEEPIQPEPNWHAPHTAFTPIPPPGPPDSAEEEISALYQRTRSPDANDATDAYDEARREHGFASNNWAVAPRRTKNGYALLEGDPHLDLSLPSIWYEAQIVVPGKLDVYGVTIPGAPGIVIGFNRDIAWTFTNTGADVMDFYRETVDDSVHPTRYMLDGAWHTLSRRVEQYRGNTGVILKTDTVLFTHRGPMLHQRGQWLSMRWTVLEPSEELQAFYDVAHARTAREFQDDMARSYFVPAQNMLVADRAGSIAIRSTGHFPLRPDDGSGLVVRDGSTSSSDWRGYWPVDRYPQSFDPAQGFLASANQEPEAPESEFAYLGDDQDYEVWRALRINELLRADSAVTPDDMRRWQTDPGSVRADIFVPYFLHAAGAEGAPAAEKRTGGGRVSGSDENKLTGAARLLGEWDRRYTRDNERAVLFEAAMRQLTIRTWDELAPHGKRVGTPSSAVLAELLTQPNNQWWDDRHTRRVVETRDDILAASLVAGYNEVLKQYGAPDAGGWRWSKIRQVNIYHLLHLPAFSMLNIPARGGIGTLSPSYGDGTEGPSWRMVVELGPEVHGWGTLPGGESGDPSSPRYTDHLPSWIAGTLDPLIFPHSARELSGSRTSATLTLTPNAR
ncbi:MAG: penicillin acylase family protein [Gemmatimonadaceae bacterium]